LITIRGKGFVGEEKHLDIKGNTGDTPVKTELIGVATETLTSN
jgi:hypothetical protein